MADGLDTSGGLVARRARLVLVLTCLSAKLVAQVPGPDQDFIRSSRYEARKAADWTRRRV